MRSIAMDFTMEKTLEEIMYATQRMSRRYASLTFAASQEREGFVSWLIQNLMEMLIQKQE